MRWLVFPLLVEESGSALGVPWWPSIRIWHCHSCDWGSVPNPGISNCRGHAPPPKTPIDWAQTLVYILIFPLFDLGQVPYSFFSFLTVRILIATSKDMGLKKMNYLIFVNTLIWKLSFSPCSHFISHLFSWFFFFFTDLQTRSGYQMLQSIQIQMHEVGNFLLNRCIFFSWGNIS